MKSLFITLHGYHRLSIIIRARIMEDILICHAAGVCTWEDEIMEDD